MNLLNTHIPKISWRLLWLISILLFIYLGRNAFHGSEASLAEKAREMLLIGDYFHHYNNWCIQAYSSPINTWLILPFQKFFGQDEFFIRLPGAIAALSSIAGIIVLTKQLFSNRTALLAAWMYISTYGFITTARNASIDTISLSASLWALVFYFDNEEEKIFWKSLLFWILIFLSAASANITTAVIALSILAPRILRKKSIKNVFSYRNIIAFFIGSIIFMIPLILYYGFDEEYNFKFSLTTCRNQSFNWDSIKPQLIGSIYYLKNINFSHYFHKNIFSIFRILLPWSPLIFVSIYYMLSNRSKYSKTTFDLIKGTLCGWIIFILSTPNHWEQGIILLPIIIITTAQYLSSFEEEITNKNKYPNLLNFVLDIYYYLAIFISALFLSTIFMMPLWHSIMGIVPPTMLLINIPIGGLLTLLAIRMDWQDEPNPLTILTSIPRKLAAIFVGYSLLMIITWSILQPGLTEFRTKKTFFKTINNELKHYKPKQIYFYNSNVEPAFLYYLDIADSVLSNSCPKKHKKSLTDFIADNKGQKIAIICNNEPKNLHSLTSQLEELKSSIKDLSFKEEPHIEGNIIFKKNTKWRVYFITLLENNSQN